jgi:GTPase SAR1 family protein
MESTFSIPFRCFRSWSPSPAGQEAYLAISQLFYRDASAALVCYSPSDPERIETWIKLVHEQVPKCAIVLVATKADMLSDAAREDLFNRGPELTQAHDALTHYITSAKTGLSVKDAFFGAAQASVRAAHPPFYANPEQQGHMRCC